MHRLLLLTLLSKLQRAQGVDKLGKLLLDVPFILAVNLQSHVLNWVLLEGQDILLGGHEQWKRDLEKDLLNVWLDHRSGVFLRHALSQELDGQSESSGSNELSFFVHEDLEVGFVQSLEVHLLESGGEVLHLVLVVAVGFAIH